MNKNMQQQTVFQIAPYIALAIWPMLFLRWWNAPKNTSEPKPLSILEWIRNTTLTEKSENERNADTVFIIVYAITLIFILEEILFHFYEQYQQSLVLVEGPKTDYPFVEHRQNGRRLYSLKNTSIKVLKDGDKNEENNNIKLVEEFLSKHSDLKNNKLPQSALSVIVAAPGIQFSNYNLYTFIPQKVYATSKIFSCYQFITKNIQVKWFNDGKNVILAGYIINLGDAVCLEKQLNLLARKLEAQEAEERSRNINRRILYRSTWCNHFNAQCVSYRKERREGEAEEEKENYLDTVALMFSPVESRIRRANCADCRQREEDCEESSQYVFIEHIDHNRPRS